MRGRSIVPLATGPASVTPPLLHLRLHFEARKCGFHMAEDGQERQVLAGSRYGMGKVAELFRQLARATLQGSDAVTKRPLRKGSRGRCPAELVDCGGYLS